MRTKAISPVIATVIIVSVAIAIAVAVAFWMTGITGLFTRYEKLDVINAYALYNSSEEVWAIVLTIKNTGTTDATLDQLFVNGKPFNTYTYSYAYPAANLTTFKGVSNAIPVTSNTTTPTYTGDYWAPGSTTKGTYSLASGDEVTFVVPLSKQDDFASGQIVEIKIHTAAGNEYPKSVQLP